MNRFVKWTISILFTCALAYVSCTKELSCESDCDLTDKPPVAIAGKDTLFVLPRDTISLNGTASFDQDGSIIKYEWTKISGAGTVDLTNADKSIAFINKPVAGIYKFKLKVTDNEGLSSEDTVIITVSAATNQPAGDCPLITAKLRLLGTLSLARFGMLTASAGNKILFAGGFTPGVICTRVDIYDIPSNSWSTAELSEPRSYMTAVASGNKIFFAGGYIDQSTMSTRIDIYDASTNNWSTAELSEGRALLASAAAGNKVVFAGGYKFNNSDRVDIYDISNNSWSTASLSQGRWGLSAVAMGNKIYLAGGESRGVPGSTGASDIVNTLDVYDVTTNSWSVSKIVENKGYMPGISAGGNIYWAGGTESIQNENYINSNNAEIRDPENNISSFAPICSIFWGTDASAVQKNNDILFFEGNGNYPRQGKFNIYNLLSGIWSTGQMDRNLFLPAVISVRNIIYVAGGSENDIPLNQVWTLDY